MSRLKMGQEKKILAVTKAALQEPKKRQLDPLAPRIAVLEEAVVALQVAVDELNARLVDLEGAQP
jgi:hypothetical protein